MNVRVVIDVDDTICDNLNRDYAHAIPKKDVIDKINQLHREGVEIALHTARGQASCNGDLMKIIATKKPTLEKWLKENNVEYDELIFGKPLGDLYVDDKAMEVREFVNADFRSLKGGSNKSIYKLGRFVKKELGSQEAVLKYQTWLKENTGLCNTPHVVSWLYDSIYMDFIEGPSLYDSIDEATLKRLLLRVWSFGLKHYELFDVSYHQKKLLNNALDPFMKQRVSFNYNQLESIRNILEDTASFSHGDCILSNIIYNDNDFMFIDPLFEKSASSFLFDLAKIKMSLDGYEKRFGISDVDNSELRPVFDKYIFDEYKEAIEILEYMHIIRLYRYKNDEDKAKVRQFLLEVEERNEWRIE